MIDPKINLRIDPDTDLDLLCLATELTRKGLGFPQYSNDDVVIPGLVAHGYALEDARDYTVAACWEFIIPGQGHGGRQHRRGFVAGSRDTGHPGRPGRRRQDSRDPRPGGGRTSAGRWAGWSTPTRAAAATGSLLLGVDGPLPRTRARSIARAEIQQLRHPWGGLGQRRGRPGRRAKNRVRARRVIAPSQLLAALDADYEGYEALRRRLAEGGPKVGNNDDAADGMLVSLFDYLAAACEAVRG